jgi:hypothetical protein
LMMLCILVIADRASSLDSTRTMITLLLQTAVSMSKIDSGYRARVMPVTESLPQNHPTGSGRPDEPSVAAVDHPTSMAMIGSEARRAPRGALWEPGRARTGEGGGFIGVSLSTTTGLWS